MNAYDALRGTDGPCVLFESTTSKGPLARLSLPAREPRAVLVADPSGIRVTTPSGARTVAGDPLDALRGLLHKAEGMRLALEAALAETG
jgi:hypothetical protein